MNADRYAIGDRADFGRKEIQKAKKLLTDYERLANKYQVNLSEKRLAQLDALRDAGIITSAHLPGTLQKVFPGQLQAVPLGDIQNLKPGKN